jgi:uncharacterized iron-regulated membrane protein
MSLDLLIATVGVIVTILVVTGMVLLTPRGVETARRPRGSVASDDPAEPAPAGEHVLR